jgi:hypothetical protein
VQKGFRALDTALENRVWDAVRFLGGAYGSTRSYAPLARSP